MIPIVEATKEDEQVATDQTATPQIEIDAQTYVQAADRVKMLIQEIKEEKDNDDDYLHAKELNKKVQELRKKVKDKDRIRSLTEQLKTAKERVSDLTEVMRGRMRESQLTLFNYMDYKFAIKEVVRAKKARVRKPRGRKLGTLKSE